MNEWNQKMEEIPKWRTYPSEKPVGRNLEIAGLYGATCFYKWIQKGWIKGVAMEVRY
jgi:hypothetical protein